MSDLGQCAAVIRGSLYWYLNGTHCHRDAVVRQQLTNGTVNLCRRHAEIVWRGGRVPGVEINERWAAGLVR